MQAVATERVEKQARFDETTIPACLFLLLAPLFAILSGLNPMAFTLVTVVLFGAPHNWSEFRYLLSKLPSKFGTLRSFFMVGFTGAIFLCGVEIALTIGGDHNVLSPSAERWSWTIWNESLLAWMLGLGWLRYRHFRTTATEYLKNSTAPFLAASLANVMAPGAFTFGLTFLHPVVSFIILDRELRRSRKSFLPAYHKCLLIIPAIVIAMIFWLHSTTESSASNALYRALNVSASSTMHFGTLSPYMLLALFGFIQMVHYAIWLLAMPIASHGWKKWQLNNLPCTRDFSRLRLPIALSVAAASLIVVFFWIGFAVNFPVTNNTYLLVATFHVLAEIPFLFWMFES